MTQRRARPILRVALHGGVRGQSRQCPLEAPCATSHRSRRLSDFGAHLTSFLGQHALANAKPFFRRSRSLICMGKPKNGKGDSNQPYIGRLLKLSTCTSMEPNDFMQEMARQIVRSRLVLLYRHNHQLIIISMIAYTVFCISVMSPSTFTEGPRKFSCLCTLQWSRKCRLNIVSQ